MATISTAAGEIGYESRGTLGDRTPIVFLHGVGSDKSVWRAQLDHFGEQRLAIAFDYPGYGDSDPAPDDTSRDDYAAAILAAMRVLGVERAHICGLSLGGIVAIALHHLAPAACASLILADTFAVHPDGRAIFERSEAGSRDIAAMAEARVDLLIAQPADLAVRPLVIETMSRINPAAYRIGARAVWLADQTARATAIGGPTLMVVGAEDSITPPALSVELAALIPDAQMQVIAGAGHLANLEQPDAFNSLIDAFLERAESAT